EIYRYQRASSGSAGRKIRAADSCRPVLASHYGWLSARRIHAHRDELLVVVHSGARSGTVLRYEPAYLRLRIFDIYRVLVQSALVAGQSLAGRFGSLLRYVRNH